MATHAYEIRDLDFKTIEEEYKNVIGKTESLYTIVLFNCTSEALLEYTLNKSQLVQKIKDPHRRARARKAYYNLKEFGETFDIGVIMNYLICMDVENDKMDIFTLNNDIKDLLAKYECSNIWLRCTDHFDIVELRDYLESNEYFNMFRVYNNKITYIKIGRTKKLIADSEESRNLNISDYISAKIDLDDGSSSKAKYLAYGISSKLASLNNTDIRNRAYDVLNMDISDSDAIDLIQRMEQSDVLDELDADYELIHNPKTMHRVIFKKDFKQDKISILKRIYIDKRIL